MNYFDRVELARANAVSSMERAIKLTNDYLDGCTQEAWDESAKSIELAGISVDDFKRSMGKNVAQRPEGIDKLAADFAVSMAGKVQAAKNVCEIMKRDVSFYREICLVGYETEAERLIEVSKILLDAKVPKSCSEHGFEMYADLANEYLRRSSHLLSICFLSKNPVPDFRRLSQHGGLESFGMTLKVNARLMLLKISHCKSKNWEGLFA